MVAIDEDQVLISKATVFIICMDAHHNRPVDLIPLPPHSKAEPPIEPLIMICGKANQSHIGPDKYSLKCRSCQSIRHPVKDCPDSYENLTNVVDVLVTRPQLARLRFSWT